MLVSAMVLHGACASAVRSPTIASPAPRRRPAHNSSSEGRSRSLDPSLEELEGGLRRARDGINKFVGRLRRIFRKNRSAVMAAGGVLGLLHGGAVCFTVLFVQSFGASGWPLMRSGLQRGAEAYEEAKARQQPRETADYAASVSPLKRRMVELAAELAALRREGGPAEKQAEVLRRMREVRRELEAVPPRRRAAPVLVAACEPAVLRDVALGVWSGVTVSLAAAYRRRASNRAHWSAAHGVMRGCSGSLRAPRSRPGRRRCSSAARTVGIGVSLGEAVANAMTAVLGVLEPAVRRALSVLPAEAVMLTYLGPSLFGSAALSLLGRSVGCW